MSKTKEKTRLAHNAFVVARNKTYTRNISLEWLESPNHIYKGYLWTRWHARQVTVRVCSNGKKTRHTTTIHCCAWWTKNFEKQYPARTKTFMHTTTADVQWTEKKSVGRIHMHALRKTISIAWKNYKLFMPIPNEHSPPSKVKWSTPKNTTNEACK